MVKHWLLPLLDSVIPTGIKRHNPVAPSPTSTSGTERTATIELFKGLVRGKCYCHCWPWKDEGKEQLHGPRNRAVWRRLPERSCAPWLRDTRAHQNPPTFPKGESQGNKYLSFTFLLPSLLFTVFPTVQSQPEARRQRSRLEKGEKWSTGENISVQCHFHHSLWWYKLLHLILKHFF